MTRLSVNINKFATLRNARGGNNPDVVKAAMDCERFGAQGITVHPRPDERHITTEDVYALKDVVTTEFNIEGYPDKRFLNIINEIRPAQATLVPDGPDVLTSNAGWNTLKNNKLLTDVIKQLKDYGVRVSIFTDPDIAMVNGAKEVGADRIELYTESYATGYSKDKTQAIAPYKKAAIEAVNLGLGVNAGHDLDLENLNYLITEIPEIDEVSIGHALICDSLYLGLENTIQRYLKEVGFYK
ncbi:MAG: pyridoxine 5'-phosphate synthase [Fulvivirga sp.]|uniref:pyridoxine 5'-phosphate synthase n=1 Tax=Fulvivirga sp. TaxID=1931237 RepID=UPI0032EE4C51